MKKAKHKMSLGERAALLRRRKKAREEMRPHYIDPEFLRRKKNNKDEPKKVSFDVHGVIDANSDFFRILLADLIKQGWEVHIITGAQWSREKENLQKLQIPFTHFFSIVDHHVEIGTRIRWDEHGNAHIDEWKWDRTKGRYCARHNIDMHFDDSDIYAYFFKTPYTRYLAKNSARVKKMHI